MVISAIGEFEARITFDGRAVTVEKPSGLTGWIYGGGGGARTAPLSAVTSVQVKPAGRFTLGWLTVTLAGELPLRGGRELARRHPWTVLFAWSYRGEFDTVYRAIINAQTVGLAS